MSWSVTAKGAASSVLQSLEAQFNAVKKNLEDTKAKEEPLLKAHLEALLHFLSQKLSNLGSKAHVEVTAVGHKAEDKVHEMTLTIKHVEPPAAEAPKPLESGEPVKALESASASANG